MVFAVGLARTGGGPAKDSGSGWVVEFRVFFFGGGGGAGGGGANW